MRNAATAFEPLAQPEPAPGRGRGGRAGRGGRKGKGCGRGKNKSSDQEAEHNSDPLTEDSDLASGPSEVEAQPTLEEQLAPVQQAMEQKRKRKGPAQPTSVPPSNNFSRDLQGQVTEAQQAAANLEAAMSAHQSASELEAASGSKQQTVGKEEKVSQDKQAWDPLWF